MADEDHIAIRRHGKVVGYKPRSKSSTKKVEPWDEAEKSYRAKHRLPFTAQRKEYWDKAPKEGVPSFRAYYKKWQAKQKGKKAGQKKAVDQVSAAKRKLTDEEKENLGKTLAARGVPY